MRRSIIEEDELEQTRQQDELDAGAETLDAGADTLDADHDNLQEQRYFFFSGFDFYADFCGFKRMLISRYKDIS